MASVAENLIRSCAHEAVHNGLVHKLMPVDNRSEANGAQVSRLAGLAMKNKPSVDFSGYWQRRKAA